MHFSESNTGPGSFRELKNCGEKNSHIRSSDVITIINTISGEGFWHRIRIYITTRFISIPVIAISVFIIKFTNLK